MQLLEPPLGQEFPFVIVERRENAEAGIFYLVPRHPFWAEVFCSTETLSKYVPIMDASFRKLLDNQGPRKVMSG